MELAWEAMKAVVVVRGRRLGGVWVVRKVSGSVFVVVGWSLESVGCARMDFRRVMRAALVSTSDCRVLLRECDAMTFWRRRRRDSLVG